MAAAIGLGAVGVIGAIVWNNWFAPAAMPKQPEYLPAGRPVVMAQAKSAEVPRPNGTGATVFDFNAETTGAPPKTFVPVVGNWLVGIEGENRVLVVDGRAWKEGQAATGIAEQARSLYGERYAEFLDNVKAFAYFPYAVAQGVEDFRNGEITMRFKGIAGRIDQGAGILFNLKPNGDYLAMRANPLENNLVLWKFEKGRRSSVKWIRDTPTPTRQWHDIKLVVRGAAIEGYVNGKLYLTHTLPAPVSGRIGVWSKADSVVYFDDYAVRPGQ